MSLLPVATLLLAGTISLQADTPPPPPDAQVVADTAAALRDCHLADPALLSNGAHAALEVTIADAADAELRSANLGPSETLVLNHLRRIPSPTTADAFHARCRTYIAALALRHLRPDQPFSEGPLAWIPLLAVDGDYDGSGYFLVFDAGRWRLPLEPLDLQIPATLRSRTPTQVAMLTAMQRREQLIHGPPDEDVLECPLAPALEAGEAKVDDDDERRYDWAWIDADDEHNLRGYLQRRAVEYYGSSTAMPPTSTARALYVELLYRRAFFDNGPGLGSPLWAERLAQAHAAMRQALALGSDLTRLGPVLNEIAALHERGAGALLVDPGTAAELYRIAALLGDADAAIAHARYLAWGLDGQASDCAAAEAVLKPLIVEGHDQATLEAAWIKLACPDPAQRSAAAALDWIERNDLVQRESLQQRYRPDAELLDIAQTARCVAAAERAEVGAEASDCREPGPRVEAIDWLRQRFADKQARDQSGELGIGSLPGPSPYYEETPTLAVQSCTLPD